MERNGTDFTERILFSERNGTDFTERIFFGTERNGFYGTEFFRNGTERILRNVFLTIFPYFFQFP